MNVTEVPAQIVVAEAEIDTEGTCVGLTVIVLVAEVVPQEPPLVVSVKVIVPDSVALAV